MPDPTEAIRCPGMRDLVGDEMERVRAVEAAFAAACRAWGFREVRTPLIEYLHLYTMSGALSPQLLSRVYSFLDWDGWSGERVVLRPDSTVAVARLYGERFAGGPARVFYRQSVLRFAPGDEQRESWQAGAEVIGIERGATDIELILLAAEVFGRLGLPAPRILVSHPGIIRAVLAGAGFDDDERVALYDRILEGDQGAILEIENALPDLGSALKILFEVDGSGPEYIKNVRSSLADALPGTSSPLDELAEAAEAISSLGVTYTIRTALVRNFEYYTGVVFHLEGQEGRLGGGGRYDTLAESITGTPAAACGFAIDTESVAELLGTEGRTGSTAVAVMTPSEAVVDGLGLVRALHGRGLDAVLNPGRPNGLSVTVVADGFEVPVGYERRVVNTVDAAVAALEEAAKGSS
ncbi:MAG: ATP phosphoribosyltransferase regulatory subunit [Dehalococcoidia bacterium]|nr:ATP phosphoribosyltransferase regulatory subunit [Dehalococcoidia bacterium]